MVRGGGGGGGGGLDSSLTCRPGSFKVTFYECASGSIGTGFFLHSRASVGIDTARRIPTDSTCRFQSAPPPSCLLWTECKLRCSVFGASEPPKQASFSASLSHNNKYAMAEGVPVLSARMRENLFIGENGTDSLETESQGSRDEIIERDPGCVEDRFRVDRKKLEQMLQLGKFFTFFKTLRFDFL